MYTYIYIYIYICLRDCCSTSVESRGDLRFMSFSPVKCPTSINAEIYKDDESAQNV